MNWYLQMIEDYCANHGGFIGTVLSNEYWILNTDFVKFDLALDAKFNLSDKLKPITLLKKRSRKWLVGDIICKDDLK